MILLDLDNCNLGYCLTHRQRGRFPARFHDQLRVIFDGIDATFWAPAAPAENRSRRVGDLTIPSDVRVLSYATRGMKAMRGFDIFMKVAKKLCDRRKDVLVLIAGADRVCYGGEERVTGEKFFKEWVLAIRSTSR